MGPVGGTFAAAIAMWASSEPWSRKLGADRGRTESPVGDLGANPLRKVSESLRRDAEMFAVTIKTAEQPFGYASLRCTGSC